MVESCCKRDFYMMLENKRVIVCMGPGGVGKTTISASLALEAASRGRRVHCLTIDPARRLANAIGIESWPASGWIDLTTRAASEVGKPCSRDRGAERSG